MRTLLRDLAFPAMLLVPVACSSAPTGSPFAGSPGGEQSGTMGEADPNCDVPTTAAALDTYLHGAAYRSFPHEAVPHPSDGPHAAYVQTYITPSLDASLKADSAEHPRCAAMVKEFYDGPSSGVTGWAVAVKLAPTSDAGRNWYWYETLNVAPHAAPSSSGNGLTICTGCHAMGRDFVRSAYPLQ